MIMYHRILLFVLLFSNMVSAQPISDCDVGQAGTALDVNNVRAWLTNTGRLFGKGRHEIYQVPKRDSINATSWQMLWMGGRVDGELRIAASDYYPAWWPGPLDVFGNPPADCQPYDRLFKIDRRDIERYNATGEATPDLAEWPWDLGAPVVDGDGVVDNYNLEGGDRPELMGDQMVWWVMNDRGKDPWWFNSHVLPMGMEVKVTAFAFDRRSYQNALDPLLQHTTFYRYRLTYRGNAPLEDLYFGLWTEVNLGGRNDDFVGSDSTLHLTFVYNGREEDTQYGMAPPAIGTVVLKGPKVPQDGRDNDRDGRIDEADEHLGLSAFAMHFKGTNNVQGHPSQMEHAYGYMQNRWLDGVPITYGGRGRGFSNTPTRFMFSGNPPDFWSEENPSGHGPEGVGGYRWGVTTSGPFRMVPGEQQEILVAIVWARGQDRLDSVYKLKAGVHVLHEAVAAGLLKPDASVDHRIADAPERYLVYHNYPNPFATRTTIQYDLPQDRPVHLTVYDVLGRPIRTLVDAHQSAGSYAFDFDATGLPSGLYLARLRLGYLERTLRMIRHP